VEANGPNDIMTWAEENRGGALVPFIARCLFAGIRPDLDEGEISTLEAKDVRLDTGVRTLRLRRSSLPAPPGRKCRSLELPPASHVGGGDMNRTWIRAYALFI
jgi:hypothetical protein